MKTILVVVLCIGTVFNTVVPHLEPIQSHVPLTYKVQIDDPPMVRWAPLIRDYNQSLHRLIQFFDVLPIPKGFFDGVQWYAKNQFKYQDFVNEVDAVAKLTCTGIIIRTAQGKVMHGRNLDFEMWQLLAKLLANVQYYRGDKRLFSIDTVVGSVFALTGIRHGAFAVNCDTRYAKHFSDDLISVLKNNSIPTLWLLRNVLVEETNYASAVKRLKTQPVGGPVYFIISGVGPNEGMVIERDTTGTHAYYQLSEDNWFIIQTNYDRDQPQPLYDPRRIPVEKKMRERGNKNFTQQTLLTEFMSQWPTFNIATIMTAVMVPSTGYHNTTAWYGINPTPKQHKLTHQ